MKTIIDVGIFYIKKQKLFNLFVARKTQVLQFSRFDIYEKKGDSAAKICNLSAKI